MKKRYILLAAALLLILSACGKQTAQETPAAETAASTAQPTVTVTAAPAPEVASPPAVRPSVEPSVAPTATPAPIPSRTPVTPAPTPEPAPEPTPEPTAQATPDMEPTPELMPETEDPSDEEVLTAYWEANQVFGWFAGYDDIGLDLDMAHSYETPEERAYYRVTRPGLDSTDRLRAYLKALFSDEIVDNLLDPDEPIFLDGEEGGLYALPASRGADVTKGGVTLSVVRSEEPPRCAVRAVVQIIDPETMTTTGEEEYIFPYEHVGDKWVFTRFVSIF